MRLGSTTQHAREEKVMEALTVTYLGKVKDVQEVKFEDKEKIR